MHECGGVVWLQHDLGPSLKVHPLPCPLSPTGGCVVSWGHFLPVPVWKEGKDHSVCTHSANNETSLHPTRLF